MQKIIKIIKHRLLRIKYRRWNKRLAQTKDILFRETLFKKFTSSISYYSHEETLTFNRRCFRVTRYTQDDINERFTDILSSKKYVIPKPFYLELTNAQLIGHMAIAVKDENILLESTYNSLFYLNKTGDAKFLMNINKYSNSQVKYKKIISLVDILDGNYFFWMTNFLPQLEPHLKSLRQDPEFKLLISKKPKKFQLESLKILGLTENIEYWSSVYAEVETLIVPSVRNEFIPYDDHLNLQLLSPSSIFWLRTHLITKVEKHKPKNIYISRRNAFLRNIINENQLEEVFQQYNIHSVILEELSLLDQIQLFVHADNIIAPHGAGLINVMFSRGASIIEFFPKGYALNKSNIFQLSNHLDHKYNMILLDPINDHMDMEIPPSLFKEIFEKYMKKN
ncbi:glycosyltransferase family 61 protein [Reichenbachiella sp.]